jgi:hypothetical protein
MSINQVDLGNCIILFENVFNPDGFIEELESECAQTWGYLSWYMSKVGTSSQQSERPDYRSSLACNLGVLATPILAIADNRILPLAEKWQKIHADIEKTVWMYRNMYNINVTQDEGFLVNKYAHGAEYKGHVDHHPSNERVFSCVAFLNDNFHGGELVFPLQNITIKPKTGSIVFFPSNFPYFHYANQVGVNNAESLSVSNDIKYSVVTWFR